MISIQMFYGSVTTIYRVDKKNAPLVWISASPTIFNMHILYCPYNFFLPSSNLNLISLKPLKWCSCLWLQCHLTKVASRCLIKGNVCLPHSANELEFLLAFREFPMPTFALHYTLMNVNLSSHADIENLCNSLTSSIPVFCS